MKKIIGILIFVLSFFISFAQPAVVTRSSDVIVASDGGIFARNTMRPPVFLDTTAANASPYLLDSCGRQIFTYSNNSYWLRECNPKRWVKLLKTGDVSAVQANNGLSVDNNVVQLGGALIKDTEIDGTNSFGIAATGLTLFNVLNGTGIGADTWSQILATQSITLRAHTQQTGIDQTISVGQTNGLISLFTGGVNDTSDFHVLMDTVSKLRIVGKLPSSASSGDSVLARNSSNQIVMRAQSDIAGGGTNNANIAPGYRWLIPSTQEIKGPANSNTILWDSTSTANALTAKADTSVLATQFDLTQITGDTSLFTNIREFGAVGDGVTDNTIAINNAIIAATTNGKPIVYMPPGTYLIRTNYRDTAVVYQPTGIHVASNITMMGAGIGETIIRVADSLVSSTFTGTGPVTFTTNTSFWHIISGANVSNVILRDFSINGNLLNQVNYRINPYNNPQDSTHTDSTETDAIHFAGGFNNKIINVAIDSCVGYGVANFGSRNLLIDRSVVTNSINGGIYFRRNSDGSSLINSIITNNHADNVRVRSSQVSIINNEISWTKFNPNPLLASFAGIYLEADTGTTLMPPSIEGVRIIGNYLHDNSSFGFDAFNRDTLLYTYGIPSVIFQSNTVYRNANGGVTLHMPFMLAKDNIIADNGADSLGQQDPHLHSGVGVRPSSFALGSEIDNNTFRDIRGFQTYGLGGVPSDIPRGFKFTNNYASGGSGVFNPSAVSNVHLNQYFGNYHFTAATPVTGDFFKRTNGNFLIMSTTGGVDFGTTTLTNQYSAFLYPSNGEYGLVGQQAGTTNHLGILFDSKARLGGSAGTTGREIVFWDFQNSVARGGWNVTGDFIVGTTAASNSFKARQRGIDLAALFNQVEVTAAGSGSAASSVQSALRVQMTAGYTGNGTNIGVYSTNTSVTTGNNIGGAGVFRGALAFYGGSTGSASAGANAGGLFFSTAALKNVGIIGDATVSQRNDASAHSIGVIGYGLRNNVSAIHIGGYFGLQSTQPTFASAALVSDNGAQTDPIFLGRDNGTVKFSIKDGGNTAINTTGGATDIDQRLLYVNGSIGANKDSITTITSLSTHFILVQDTSAAPELGKFKKILASNLGLTTTTQVANQINDSLDLRLSEGSYTPSTGSTNANLDAFTLYEVYYSRSGNNVTVWGRFEVDPTLTATSTILSFTLPPGLGSDFSAIDQAGGTAFASAIAGQGAAIRSNPTDDEIEVVWIAGDVTNQIMHFSFTYRLLGGAL